jgi:para-aminobenzoate synthetase/4-amino-4-deoxychorismate lyase
MRRLSSSARYFGFRFRRDAVLAALGSAIRGQGTNDAGKVRLLLRRDGHVSVTTSPFPDPGKERRPCPIALSRVAVSSRDPFVRHKTTNRAWRDDELRKAREAGCEEVLFLNERGELAEGAITNVFLEISGRLVTPPAACGLLEGVYRRRILSDRRLRATERVLFPEDLERADKIFLTNSVRENVPAVLSPSCRNPARA